jgi:glutamate dehydrogenase
MQRHTGRAELIDRLIPELERDQTSDSKLMAAFGRAVLRRVDDRYLFRHRMTTLSSQLRDSFSWVSENAGAKEIKVRVFKPVTEIHGYELDGWVVETLMPDQPFIVDTSKLFFERAGVRTLNRLSVILPAVFDENRALTRIGGSPDQIEQVSYARTFVDLGENADPETVTHALTERLTLAAATVSDFSEMVDLVSKWSGDFVALGAKNADWQDPCSEVADFLSWLSDDNFVFMGVFRDDGSGGSKLGIETQSDSPIGSFCAEHTGPPSWPIVRVGKSDQESLVHRGGKVDEIRVRLFDEDGKSLGGALIRGLFTFKGLGESGGQIPIVRRTLAAVLEESETVPGSFEHKALVNAFNSLPVEYLFEADRDTVTELLETVTLGDSSREIYAQLVLNDDGTSAYAFVVFPKEEYSDDMRAMLEAVLRRELNASYVDHRVHLGKYGGMALHFYATGAEDFGTADVDSVREILVETGTPWSFRLRLALEERQGESKAAETFSRWSQAFGEVYTNATLPEHTVRDIEHLQAVLDGDSVRFELVGHPAAPGHALLRIYSREHMDLTSLLPVIDNFGIVVVEQSAFEVCLERDSGLTVNTLHVHDGNDSILTARDNLIDGLRAVSAKRMRSDRLNRLMTAANLNWKEVDLFRALFHYSRLLGHQVTAEIVQKVLCSQHELTSDLALLFRLRFEPSESLSQEARAEQVKKIETRIKKRLSQVSGFEEDRLLRTYLNLIQSILRTNFYRGREDGEHFISFKIDCSLVTEMPDPRPMREIYVHHSKMEGVHLRGGRVARGGLRWSDRLDDYRTEVLGLMATQMLKNAMIVPVGAKGGFILKDPVEDYNESRARADELYKIFIRGLLEVTDNLVEGEVIPPPNVVRYDDDDPYLVVAADKGTAHLSDTANGIAASFDFWLGDAFASGGSVGYDHKIKGITARGAWVCVQRLFKEIGIDPEADPITAVGIGDMSGDVFGNGMLLSKSMKVVGAFNHRHIFVDPDPDPGASWQERKRLFDTPRTQWTDYNPELISEGGGVFERGAKSITLTDPMRALLQTEEETVSGEALIRMILKAEVDLLWNGGIGTYVKASRETHADVGDKANDRVRVDAEELHCRVIGEGGNLGITQSARVDYSALGGLIHLDAIDNSGGVDLSDHEVNLKILLQPVVASGRISPEDRNALLTRVGDGICDTVLQNNYDQALALSLDVVRSRRDIWAFVRATDFLREALGFKRHQERLPRRTGEIEKRIQGEQGYFRPELGKLLAFVKRHVYQALVEQPLGSMTTLRPWLELYFPQEVVDTVPDDLEGHMLASEIAATLQTNHIIDQAGISFFCDMMVVTERSAHDVAAAYLIGEDVLDARTLREEIAAAGDLSSTEFYDALLAVEESLADVTRWILELNPGELSLEMLDQVSNIREAAQDIDNRWRQVLPVHVTRDLQQQAHARIAAGLDARTARRIACLPAIVQCVPIAAMAKEGVPGDIATAYFAVGYGSRVIALVEAINRQVYRNNWDWIAATAIQRSLFTSLRRLVEVLAKNTDRVLSHAHIQDRLDEHEGLADLRRDLEGILTGNVPVSAMYVISERFKRRVRALSN